jgi:protein-tyrosine sulfotransferase
MSEAAKAGPGQRRPPGQAPVIVLTMARSGSTLLRFILDSHPELACPPETNLGSVCFMLARLWDLLGPRPDGEAFRPREAPADVPEAALASIRGLVDDVYGRYLARHGKRRWCDKSLDNMGIAGLLAEIYPEAQFVCLYRHCLDVIVSAVEACPWGLTGYGLDQYVERSRGNNVAAVALAWLDRTRPIIDFQERHPDRCHGIRYEDLVTEPEEATEALFDFLGVQRVPGITAACFAADHEARGPGDHKIWFTTSISRASLGQGIRVPLELLPPEMRTEINQTLAQLEYRLVDDRWPATAGPVDPRASHEAGPAGYPAAPSPGADDAAAAAALAARLAAAAAGPPAALAAPWPAAGQQLALLIGPGRGAGPARGWTISREDSGLIIRDGAAPTRQAWRSRPAAPPGWRS